MYDAHVDVAYTRLASQPGKVAGTLQLAFDLPESAIDEGRELQTLENAVRRPSITGNEAGFAGDLAGLMSEVGVTPVRCTEFAPGRPNM
jgi:hypothetical protein